MNSITQKVQLAPLSASLAQGKGTIAPITPVLLAFLGQVTDVNARH